MKHIPTQSLIPGMMVGREVTTENGVILIEKGMCLTKSQIKNLQSWGVRFLCISDSTDILSDTFPGLALTKASFMKRYFEAVESLKQVFEISSHFKQLPIIEIRTLADQMISPLVNTIGVLDYLYEMESHCNYTFQHLVNVAIVTGIISRWLNFDAADYRDLVLAGLLHDIGKLFIPLAILDKPDKLSDGEFEIIKQHTLQGYNFIKDSTEISEKVKTVILQHHERNDGSGYPFGLVGKEIHEYAKVVAIADIYEAMTSNRPYRSRLTPFIVMELIIEQMHTKLDSGICIPFLDRMRDHFIGSDVLLSNGQQAKVIVLPSREWTKPLVRTRDGKLLDLQKEKIEVIDFTGS